jgi:hypothetical protein
MQVGAARSVGLPLPACGERFASFNDGDRISLKLHLKLCDIA